MNKLSIVGCLLLLVALQSCGVFNTLTKRKKDNYVNYNLLFADPAANNALSGKAPITIDNKVRVITINQITGDTIIEWLEPVLANNAARAILPVKDLSSNNLENMSTSQDALSKNHKAIIISYTNNNEPSYQVINDTVFVRTDSVNAYKILSGLATKSFDEADTKKGFSIGAAIKNIIKPDNNNKNTPITVKPPTANDSVFNAPRNSKTLYANANTIVGDLYFDTDNTAEVITDLDTIKSLLSVNKIVWNNFKCKAHVKLKAEKDNKTFNVNLRMLQDSITWASVGLLGLEFVRAKISKKEIGVLDYSKNKYFQYDPNQLETILDIPVAFSTLQNFIIGEPPVGAANNMLAKRNANGVAIKVIGDGSNSVFTYNADSTLKAVVIVTNKGGKNYSITAKFNNYINTSAGKISLHREISVLENKKLTMVEADLSKLEFETENLNYPYTIPQKFKKGNE